MPNQEIHSRPETVDCHVAVDLSTSGSVSVSVVRTHGAGRCFFMPSLDLGIASDRVQFWIQLAGSSRVAQAGREAFLNTGDVALTSSVLPCEWQFDGPSEQAVMGVPVNLLRRRSHDLRNLVGRRIPASIRATEPLPYLVTAFQTCDERQAQESLALALIHAFEACALQLHDEPQPERHGCGGDRARAAEAGHLHSALSGPSPREMDVLNLIARGCSYADAAKLLRVSTSTVCTHLRSVYSKLGAHNKNEAVFEARQLGWLT